MKTEGWIWRGPGEPETLELGEVVLPEPGPGEVCVENRAIGLNPVDWKLVEGGHPAWKAGQVPGVDGAGIVVATGVGVPEDLVGARVAYHADLRHHGSFARHTHVPARALLSVPDGLMIEAAAGFPCPGLTALQILGKMPDLAGESVLLTAAAGAVGRIVSQLAVSRGARVFATAAKKNHEWLHLLGVAEVADYRDPDWESTLLAANGGKPFHAVIDLVSSAQALRLAAHLGYYGHLVSVLGQVGKNPFPGFTRCISLHEIALGAQHEFGTDRQWKKLIQAGDVLLHQMEMGALTLPAIETGDFPDLSSVLSEFRSQGQGRKYVIRVRDAA